MSPRRRGSLRRGYSLLEVLVTIVVLSLGLLAIATAAGLSFRDMSRSRRDTQYWADVQQVLDSLTLVGWAGVTNGSTTIRGRPISWTVSTVNSKTKQLAVLVTRYQYLSLTSTVEDPVTLTLSSPSP